MFSNQRQHNWANLLLCLRIFREFIIPTPQKLSSLVITDPWLALVIGNTRLHWGYFAQQQLMGAWHTPHLALKEIERLQKQQFWAGAWRAIEGLTLEAGSLFPEGHLLEHLQKPPPAALWVASVVLDQTVLWQKACDSSGIVVEEVIRAHIPLANLYPTLGLDRAINLLGAGSRYGWPVLVIDGGTALTFTAGEQGAIYGGAILPGLRLQGQALAQGTPALATAVQESLIALTNLDEPLALDRQQESDRQGNERPVRWATDTAGAIASGLMYGAIATLTDTLTDWWQRFPTGYVVFTGGDGLMLHDWVSHRMNRQPLKPQVPNQIKTPERISRVHVDSRLMFWGMQAYRQAVLLQMNA